MLYTSTDSKCLCKMCNKSYLKAIEKFGVKTWKVHPLHVFFKIAGKVSFNNSTMPKIVNLASIWKPIACGQIVLPDRSIFIGQKLAKNAINVKLKCDILGDFQTL